MSESIATTAESVNASVTGTPATTGADIAKSMAARLGTGACRILNSFREASDEFEDYYDNKENRSVMDHVMHAANTLGRGGATIAKGAIGLAGKAWNSDIAKSARSGMMNAYESLREKYSGYLTRTAEDLAKENETASEKGFGLKFRTFLNTALTKIDGLYSKGEDKAKSFAHGLSEVKDNIKSSGAYAELAGKAAEIEVADAGRDDIETGLEGI